MTERGDPEDKIPASEQDAFAEPSMAERVQFWQEQDRINRELIPRVIKSHEQLTKHIELHEDGDPISRAQIAELEARLAAVEREGDSGDLARWLPYTATGLAVVALVVAIGAQL